MDMCVLKGFKIDFLKGADRMKVEIELTDQQVKFLKEFAIKQAPGSDDNRCTSMPIHVVQTRRERVVDTDFEDSDKTCWIICGDCETQFESIKEVVNYYHDDECPVEVVDFVEYEEIKGIDGEEHYICDEEDYFIAYGIPTDYCYKCEIKYYYEPVAFFFILDEAKRYMEYQGHNLESPRTYTYGSGYSNCGDYEHFYSLLMKLGKQLNELQS